MINHCPTNDNLIDNMKTAVGQAIEKKLTHRQKEILFLYYYDEKTMPQIASELGIAKQNVSKNIQRAIINIKKSPEVKNLF